MLRPKVLPKVLEQANSKDVVATMLLNKEGSLLASAPVDYSQAQVISAIIANIWQSYSKNGEEEVMLLDLQEGNVAVTKVGKLLVCTVGAKTSHMGMLRAKILALRQHMQEPLSHIEA